MYTPKAPAVLQVMLVARELSEIGMSNKQGFSLLELLVVLVIIGITLRFALLSFGDFGAKRRVFMEAVQFKTLVSLIQQQAVHESSTLAIKIDAHGYRVQRFQANAGWTPVSGNRALYQKTFADTTDVHFTDHPAPQAIVLNASGDMTPFRLSFGLVKRINVAVVVGQSDGTLTVESASNP